LYESTITIRSARSLSNLFIVAGLGNPGRQYEGTRHNVGFHTIHYLEEKIGFKANRLKFSSLCAEERVDGERVLFMMPQTYMNRSGIAVREAVQFYKIEPEKLIVIYDDLDIPTGRIRVRAHGSAGSHNGMRSIVLQLGTDAFPRVRIGIGEETQMDTAAFVLSRFPKEHEKEVRAQLARAGDACLDIIAHGTDHAMNCYNPKG
jgi:PTH1 family peptidyl-tRNA hydrolase